MGLIVGIGLLASGVEPGFYVSVAPCGVSELLIDLRRTEDDHVLATQKILSRYKTPDYEMRDVTGDGVDEVLVYTRGGGTGCDMNQLSIYAVNGGKLVEAARFNLEGLEASWPFCCQFIQPDGKQTDLSVREMRSNGAVEFLPDGELLYCYADAVRDLFRGIRLPLRKRIRVRERGFFEAALAEPDP